jgi:ATP-dependent Clp protease ATP-binding subunit ClpB
MNMDKYTQKSQEALMNAQQIAENLNHQEIDILHLLLSLIQQEDGVVPAIVTKVSGSVLGLKEEITKELEKRPKVYGSGTQVGLSRQVSNVLNAAEKFAKGMNDDYVSTEHILLD